MQYTDLKKQIKQNQLQNVYVLYGTERFVLLRVQQSLIEAAIGSGTAEWNFSRFDETAKPDQVHACLLYTSHVAAHPLHAAQCSVRKA